MILKRLQGITLVELLVVVANVAVLAAIAIPNFMGAQIRSKITRVKSDMRKLTTAIETYYLDHQTYPAQASSIGKYGLGANQFPNNKNVSASAGSRFAPTFRIKRNAADKLMTMTTPVAYLPTLPADSFADSKGAVYCYSTNNPLRSAGLGWIVWSYGPDGDENTPNGWSKDYKNAGGDIVVGKPGTFSPPYVSETFYNPGVQQPMLALKIHGTYDPTNGVMSNGDVWRAKD